MPQCLTTIQSRCLSGQSHQRLGLHTSYDVLSAARFTQETASGKREK